ncbi:MAG: hypothetical protein ACR2KL_00750 [Nocardioidaceae bacterium]
MTPSPTPRVVLHIGLHKTGTTYLQGVLRANRERLAVQGVDFPGGPKGPQHTFAVYDLFGRRPRGTGDDRIAGQWQAMTRALTGSALPVRLLSEEALSLATPAQVRKAVRALAGTDVHVVATVRDLGRVAVSAWQEDVKTDETWTWREYADALADPAARGKAPARGFWLRQDVPAVLASWAAEVGVERVHVVTVPPAGVDPASLLARFGEAVGFDPATLTEPARWENHSVGVAGTEVLRRMNELLHRRLNQRQYHDVVETTLAPILAGADGSSLVLPPQDRDWVEREADRMIEALRTVGYPLYGSLEELRPASGSVAGRVPGSAPEPELLTVAVAALAGLTEAQALARWNRRRPAAAAASAPAPARAGSAVRSAWFRCKQGAVGLADRQPLAERALRGYLARRRS